MNSDLLESAIPIARTRRRVPLSKSKGAWARSYPSLGTAGDQESKEGRRVDALALRGEEGRDKLRKAAGIGTYELIRGYPNGATRLVEDQSRSVRKRGRSKPAELKHLSRQRRRKQQ